MIHLEIILFGALKKYSKNLRFHGSVLSIAVRKYELYNTARVSFLL